MSQKGSSAWTETASVGGVKWLATLGPQIAADVCDGRAFTEVVKEEDEPAWRLDLAKL